jgi:hypothetical protein
MPVTDQQVTALRAYLAGDIDEHNRLVHQLTDADNAGWSALVAAGFFEAVYRRFKEGTKADVIEFVASVRARSEQLSKEIDQQIAEQLIMYSLGKGSIDGLDSRVRHLTQFGLLTALVLAERFDDASLDEFLAEARKIADQWIG